MNKVLNLYKPIGITPFQLIEKFKEKYPEYKNEKLGYAGRLDPMAEGVLLVLVGEENRKRKEYERLKKEYEFDVLFGIKTDSYDILGKVSHFTHQYPYSHIQFLTSKLIGKHLQAYPPYSSPRVKGKPLFWWAREGKLSEIEIPKKQIEIYDLDLISNYELNIDQLSKIIFERVAKVKGTFRQKEIIEGWKKIFRQNPKSIFNVAKLSVSCSSGTYIRSIANDMEGIALNIKRIKVGEYAVEDSLNI